MRRPSSIWNAARAYLRHLVVGWVAVPACFWLGTILAALVIEQALVAAGRKVDNAIVSPLFWGSNEPYFVLPVLAALYLGYRRNRDGGRLGLWIWVPALLWLALEIWRWRRMASWIAIAPHAVPGYGSWSNVLANFFGHACGGCGNEWLYTAPLYTSVAYSLGAWVRRRRIRSRAHALAAEPAPHAPA